MLWVCDFYFFPHPCAWQLALCGIDLPCPRSSESLGIWLWLGVSSWPERTVELALPCGENFAGIDGGSNWRRLDFFCPPLAVWLCNAIKGREGTEHSCRQGPCEVDSWLNHPVLASDRKCPEQHSP